MDNLNFDGNDIFQVVVNKNKISVMAFDKVTGTYSVGTAKCHKEDKFDFDYGLKLAVERCNLKRWYKKLDKTSKEIDRLRMEEDKIKENLDELEQYVVYVSTELSNQKDSIKELLIEGSTNDGSKKSIDF